jgi:hypothetical protein
MSKDIDELAHEIAKVVAEITIKSEAVNVELDGKSWRDLDTMESDPYSKNVVRYAEARGMFHHHATRRNLVQIKELP